MSSNYLCRYNARLLTRRYFSGSRCFQATGTGADGQQTYQDAARTPQAMRHMTNKLGVEQVTCDNSPNQHLTESKQAQSKLYRIRFGGEVAGLLRLCSLLGAPSRSGPSHTRTLPFSKSSIPRLRTPTFNTPDRTHGSFAATVLCCSGLLQARTARQG